MKLNKTLSEEGYVRLLEEGKYEEILSCCQDFIKRSVQNYLRNFQYYNQFSEDFLQDVYIHLHTKSLPSPAFLNACRQGNSFLFYLAKSIRNCLNTILTKEKNKRQPLIGIENFFPQMDSENQSDKFAFLEDKAYAAQTESQDLLGRLKLKFENLLKEFSETLPKIAHKLVLLLKLMARVKIQEIDLKNCFIEIKSSAIEQFFVDLGTDEVYRQREDMEIYELIYPYFQTYRNENGSPSALQRWMNAHISGDKGNKGLLDRLIIEDKLEIFKITDKKLFSDFLYLYFKSTQEKIPKIEKENTKMKVATSIQANWSVAVSKG